MTSLQHQWVLAITLLASASCKSEGARSIAVTGLTGLRQTGDDLFADLRVRQDWIAKESLLSLRLPSGESLQIHLNPVMHPGVTLRLHGKGATSNGALFLTIDTVP